MNEEEKKETAVTETETAGMQNPDRRIRRCRRKFQKRDCFKVQGMVEEIFGETPEGK